MAKTRAQSNRAIRQEALREQLSNQKLVEHVVVLAKKIEALTVGDKEYVASKLDALEGLPVSAQAALLTESVEFDLKKYKASADLNLRLVNKYLPDVRQVEIDQTIRDERAESLSDSELQHIASASGDRTSEAERSQEEPPSVH